MNRKTTIIGLHAQTSIHAGTGSSTDVIDLPIQREGHNGWPCIFGSAVKGALRSRAAEEHGKNNPSVIYVFGEDTQKANELAGAIAVSDARLLLLPVRSLTSQFKWVTCPKAIKRFKLDADRFGFSPAITDSFTVGENQAIVAESGDGQHHDRIFLEEYGFNTEKRSLDQLIEVILPLMKDVDKADLIKQLVIISDDNFTHLCQHATPVNAHIAIESDTKIVKNGALWYEETLPPETLLYFGISAVDSRNRRKDDTNTTDEPKLTAAQVIGAVTDMLKKSPWLQVGGNETVGMGWCAFSEFSDDKKEEGDKE